ncbi:MAG TPA: tail fiber domain-containing protein [Chitinophagaceae bacterium]|jgi:hypothetical protein
MRTTLLQFSTTLVFAIAGLTASAQTSWSITGNSNTTSANFIGTKNNQPFILRTNNAERMRIAKTGQVGVGGLPEPDVILKTVNTTQATAIFGFTAISSGGNGVIGEAESGNDPFGIWGISGNTDNGFAGFFDGNVGYTGTLTQFSDVRLKENIKPVESMLDKVMQLKPSSYNYKKDYQNMHLAQGAQIGFIAQEMEKVFPQLVRTMPKKNLDGTKIADFKGVNYIGLIPVLTKAIQEQQKTIADVKQENEAVKAENQELKARLDKIEQMLAINSGQQSSASSAKLSIARLEQNAPNPFNQNTVIKYYLPQNAGSAIINITDVNGRLIKTVPVTTQGNGQLTLDGGQLTSGIYQYSLIANGKLVDTKKMVLTK